MATKVRGWTVICLLLTYGKLGNTNENRCQGLAQERSLPVLSFCTDNMKESNTFLILDAYLPRDESVSSHCMCEIKVLSTYNTSVLYMKQETSLLPTANCGLKVKLSNNNQEEIRDIHCHHVVDTEYHLPRHSSITLTLSNISQTWSTGFCFLFSLRFEQATLSAQCFSPGEFRVPSTSTSSLTELSTNFQDTKQWSTSNNALSTIFTTAPTSMSTVSGSTTLIASSSNEPVISTDNPTASKSTDYFLASTTIDIKNRSETTETVEKQKITTTINYDSTSEIHQTTKSVDVQNFTTTEKFTLVTSETYQTTAKDRASTTNQYSSTTEINQSSSSDSISMTPVMSTETVTTPPLTLEVVHSTDFNVLYAVLPVSGVLLFGILVIAVILCKRNRRDLKGRQDFNSSMQNVGILSSYEADTQQSVYDNRSFEKMKEEPQFFFYEDQPISRTNANSAETQRLKMDRHYPKAGVKQNGVQQNKKHNSQTGFRSKRSNQDSPQSLIKVTINGSESFML
ncbi:uncharacterized protein LOC134275257 [Saccostrea cucullata]|uniref:uncharacterized protein LOC134275257 n=1 Tax=Saccostrea cuccullata TaxID=36930 RepID=UPI002ECFFDEA